MSPENQDKLVEIRQAFTSTSFYLGVVKPDTIHNFSFVYGGEKSLIGVESMAAGCWCTKPSYNPETGEISGTFQVSRENSYKENALLYVTEDGTPYQIGRHQNVEYFFPIIPGTSAVPKNSETDKRFKKFKGALELKEITIYFDDGEDYFLVDKNYVRLPNTNKLQTNIKIQGLVDLS